MNGDSLLASVGLGGVAIVGRVVQSVAFAPTRINVPSSFAYKHAVLTRAILVRADEFPLPDFLLDEDDAPAAAVLNGGNKRPAASSPDSHPPAPFATGAPSTLPPPQQRTNGASHDEDDFGAASLHFGGRSVGMGKSPSATSATGSLPVPTTTGQPLRKRLRRGGPEGDSEDPSAASSPHSHITSPADSDHSSAQALTSPPNGETQQSAGMRNHLERFKVDSAPSSSASSSYGGAANGGGAPVWADAQGLDDESQSQPVVIPGIAGRSHRTSLDREETMADDAASSPPRPPGGRLVRGTRPPAVEDSPASVIDVRSSPDVNNLSHPPMGARPAFPSPYPPQNLPQHPQHPQHTPQQSPYFNSQQSASPYGPPPTNGSPSFPSQMQQQQQLPPPPPQNRPDPDFQQFVTMMSGSFPLDKLQQAWGMSGRDQTRAIGILVGVPASGGQQQMQPPPIQNGGSPVMVQQQQFAGQQQMGPPIAGSSMPIMGQRQPIQVVQRPVQQQMYPGMPMQGAPHPGQMRPPSSQYPYPPSSQAYGGQMQPPSHSPLMQGGYPPQGPPQARQSPNAYPPQQYLPPAQQQMLAQQQQQQQLAIQRQQQQAQYAAGSQGPPGMPRPSGHIPYPSPAGSTPVRATQMYGSQQPHPLQQQAQPPILLRPLQPGQPVTAAYITALLTPDVLISIPAAQINAYVSPAVAACLTPPQKEQLSKMWAQVQAYRTDLQKRQLAQHHHSSSKQRLPYPQQQAQRGQQLQPRASGSGGPPMNSMQSLLSRSLAAVPYNPTPKRKRKKPTSDSDGDGGDYSDGSGDEYGGPSPAIIAKREGLAIEFFNSCTKDELSELASCTPTQATLVFKLRPFQNPNDFRTRTRKQKGVGNNMLDNYLDVIAGMGEVDKVLSDCEQIGRELSQIMKIWAQGAPKPAAPAAASPGAPTPPPGAAGSAQAADVGLSLVSLAGEEVVQAAEASQDPFVRAAFKDYIRTQPEGVPATIVLKDYQMLGLNWLNLLYRRLGKTAQVISLIAHLKSTGEPGPHLVIVPSSTLENWMREFSVFAPGLIVHSYYGSQAERQEIRAELRELEELDVVVTTYNIASSSPEDQKFLKRKMDFKIAVFDEGHQVCLYSPRLLHPADPNLVFQLKNSESKKYKDLMQIRAQWRLLLTGTPLQNNLQELVSLLSFILPDQFRDAGESLKAIFKVTPGAQVNLLSRERISRAKKMMTPFVLRRKKAQVLKDLPGKSERVEWCEMTDLQREVYNEAITRSKMALLEIQEADIETIGAEGEPADEDENAVSKPKKRGPRASSTKTGNKSDQTSGSNVLMDLRKAINHPMLFRRLYDDAKLKLMARDCLKELEFTDRDKDLIYEDMEVMTDFELHRFCLGYKVRLLAFAPILTDLISTFHSQHLEKYTLKNDEWMSAGKIQTLQRLLPELKANGDRVLLFSQFTQVLDILELVLATMGMRYLKLTGQTNVTERQGLVDEYTNDPDITVFLLSTRAGGLGLNLTSANTVILHDMDYNPHNDKQAEDRSYRIGQTRDVTVIKLITKGPFSLFDPAPHHVLTSRSIGSLEEDMRALATMKLQLDESVSSSSQYPSGAGPPTDADGNSAQVEKKMRTSLLSNLKKRFEAEGGSQIPASQTQATSPLKKEVV
ncbi:hypothetical protein P7C70_g6297, partial [Phenoliferia sp. Uapishka_3]